MINASAPSLPHQMPSAPVSAMPFSTGSQHSGQPTTLQSIPSVPTQNESFTPSPTQFGFRPPAAQTQSSTATATPPFQQFSNQFQPAVMQGPRLPYASVTTGSATPVSMAPPISAAPVGLQHASAETVPHSMPPFVSQTSSTPTAFSTAQNMTPPQQLQSGATPSSSPFMQYVKPDNMPNYHTSGEFQAMQQQAAGNMPPSSVPYSTSTSLPPSSLPPSSIPQMSVANATAPPSMAAPPAGPPTMVQFGVPGSNPFTMSVKGPHYPRPSFMGPSFQQQ